MKSLKLIYLLPSIFILHIAVALSQEPSCKGDILYGYGKLYYDNTAHQKEDIYPLTLQQKYKSIYKIIKKEKDLSSSYNNKSFMDINIKGSALNYQVTIEIVAKNKTNKTLTIPKKNLAYNNRLFGPIFHITTKCILLDYVGQTVNFGNEYHYPDDFIIINPHGEYHVSINLNGNYKFIPGRNKYYISIPNIPFSISSEDGKSRELTATSNIITINIEGKENN